MAAFHPAWSGRFGFSTRVVQACRLPLIAALAAACVLAGCGGGSGGGSSSAPAAFSAAAALGEKIFNDPGLSASGRVSCASCHSPNNAYAPPNNFAVPFGGANGFVPGFRNAPSLRYALTTPAFFFADDGTPTGGFDRDGRASDLMVQAQRPLLAPHEMANTSTADLAARLAQASYAGEFTRLFGADILTRPDDAFARVTFALAQFQKEDPDFHPYDSKYDQFLAGSVKFTDQELRGLALYNRGDKGNCAACHPSGRGADGSPPLFTDFSFDNLGVPRNASIPANADPAYYDLGLCGPFRTDLAARTDLCGAFKVPTLRNIAVTAPYFHNGRFQTLRDVVRFYVRRDTNPEEWYPLNADGSVNKFDDLPDAYKGNVNTVEVPYNRKPGDAPALNDAEIDDLLAFLNTLTDGYKP